MWETKARCRLESVDPEIFFSTKKEEQERAKECCSQCQVREQCYEAALEENQAYGIWGGFNEDERRSLKRRLDRNRRVA